MLQTLIIMTVTSLISSFILWAYLRKALPKYIELMGRKIWEKTEAELPGILEDVGVSVGDQLTDKFKTMFETPNMQRAMSILGSKSGIVRAANATREKAANGIVDQMPGVKILLDKIGVSPMEGLSLLNDPAIGPILQSGIEKLLGGLSLGGNGSPPASSSSSNPFEMS